MSPSHQRRSRFRDTGDALEWVIPAKRSWLVLLFLSVWLCGWAVGEIFAVRVLLGPRDVGVFLGFWLVGWTIGGLMAIAAWVWMAVGREVIFVRQGELSVGRKVLGFGLSREFDLTEVGNLRVTPPGEPREGGSPFGAGGVAFDYAGKTFRFGDLIGEAEGRQIVAELLEHHSSLRPGL